MDQRSQKTKEVYWSLFDEQSGRQIDGLTYTQAKGIVETIPEENHHFWLAWHEGLKKWQVLTDFEVLLDRSRNDERPLPPIPPKVKTAKNEGGHSRIPTFELDDADTESSMEIDARKRIDRRLNRRFQLEVAALGVTKDGNFMTSTVDISLGGVSFKDKIPDWITGEFNLRLTDGNRTVDLVCKPIIMPNGQTSNRARIINSEQHDELRTWILLTKQE